MPYRQIEDPHKLQRLLQAVMLLESQLDLPDLLQHFVDEATALVDARYGALGVLDDKRTRLVEFVTSGLSDEEERAIGPRPTGKGVLGLLVTSPEPLRLACLSDHPDSVGFPPHHPPMHSFLGVPIRIRDEIYGNLYLTEKQTAAEFSEEDEALVTTLGIAAAIAIENARLHDRLRESTLLEDRDRIARDLHDSVIQRLFATGLLLQGAAKGARPETAERIARAVDDLDATIRRIRTTIFELEDDQSRSGVRDSVVRVVADVLPALGFEPEVTFRGPVDTAVPTTMADHLVAVLREALTNTAKHAHASRVAVEIDAGADLSLTVTDDGCGIDPALLDAGGMGLKNLASRAERHGGALDVGPAETLADPPGVDAPVGTSLRWWVPLSSRR